MADMDIADIMLEPLASAEAVLEEQEKEGVCSFGRHWWWHTDIAIIKENIIRHVCHTL